MTELYSELQWLPRSPANFNEILKAASDSSRELQALALHALNLNQLTRVGRAISKIIADSKPIEPLVPFRLAVLSNSTLDLVIPALVGSSARHGVALDVVQSSYEQVAQEALTPDSKVNASRPDAVLFALDYRAFPLKLAPGRHEIADATIQSVMNYFKTLRDGIKNNSNATCIFQTLAPPPEVLFGSLDRALPGTRRSLIDRINCGLAKLILDTGDVLLDVAGLAETIGLAEWHDMPFWHIAKLSFSQQLVPLYADHLARTIAALRGRSRKVLVLDLDNTIWGGVIGDDGLEGINVAQGDPVGEAHLAIQQLAADLRQRGIVLAICSKNSDDVARRPFEHHAEMILRLDDFAVFQANWNDKATNIQAIAEELSVGLEAIVFLDDNPAERGLVRKLLPRVAVPELPADPALYARTLAAAGYFEAVVFSSEDLRRAGFYQDNAKRATLQKQIAGVDEYLASLDMTITFQPFDQTGRARIVQLINKSNQFNLTTRRYTENEIAAVENDPDIFALQVRLSDVFGDNGMISVVICRPSGPGEWEFDTWLMSCRVLGRKVENMVLYETIQHAKARGIQKLVGIYRPTDRNNMVRDHYAKLGFIKAESASVGMTRWELSVMDAKPEKAPMKIATMGFEALQEDLLV
jgi:FkbH-like protein